MVLIALMLQQDGQDAVTAVRAASGLMFVMLIVFVGGYFVPSIARRHLSLSDSSASLYRCAFENPREPRSDRGYRLHFAVCSNAGFRCKSRLTRLPDNEIQIDVANRDYHYQCHFEISGDKKIS